MHFALENNFIADYSSFLLKSEGIYTLRTEEDTEVVVLPRAAIEWGYEFLTQGDRLGRVIAEYLFIFMDHKRRDLYAKTPVERYESITDIYPNIHNRVPQHMIASYLGITPVHLSRLKKASQGVKV
jgi:CRP-like cAMP-binding protein